MEKERYYVLWSIILVGIIIGLITINNRVLVLDTLNPSEVNLYSARVCKDNSCVWYRDLDCRITYKTFEESEYIDKPIEGFPKIKINQTENYNYMECDYKFK